MEGVSLSERARRIRVHIIRMLLASGSGHAGGPLGQADLYAALYFGGIMRHAPADPAWAGRDRLVLSCGHACPSRYAAMAEAGYFPIDELATLRKFGSRLQGHPSLHDLPGVETSSGPLGQGLSQAVGMAIEARRTGAPWQVFAILSDGEHDEGQTWEAVMLAAARKLENLTVFVDRNFIQIDGPTEEIMPLGDMAEKYRAFGWDVRTPDPHDPDELVSAIAEPPHGRPRAFILHTVPGKGVSFMENDYKWHGKTPNAEQAAQALRELGEEARG